MRRYSTLHQSDAVSALVFGALTEPHLPAPRTPEQARKVLPWLAREATPAIAWEIDTTHPRVAKISGRIRAADPAERRDAIGAWADVIGSRSIIDTNGEHQAIGVYQGFAVELTATA